MQNNVKNENIFKSKKFNNCLLNAFILAYNHWKYTIIL